MDEEVLVFPSQVLERLGSFRGFSDRVEHYLRDILDPANLRYLARSLAEDDPSFKQVVPYVVLRWRDQIYCYERGRRGTESRLHNLLSLGVGGHIQRADGAEGPLAYETGFRRELAEEVSIESPFEERIVGFVHDDSTPVGAVHFGIVHLVELDGPRISPRDSALANTRFRSVDEVRRLRHRFESWSAFLIDSVLGTSIRPEEPASAQNVR